MENQKQSGTSDEVDLGRFFSKVGEGIGAGWDKFIRFLALLRRIPMEHKVSFIVIIAASMGIGVGYTVLLDKKFYETTMVLSSDYLNKRLAESMVEKLNTLASENKSLGLALALKIPDTLADNITGFRAVPFISESDIVDVEILKEQLRNAQISGKNEEVIDEVIERIEIENRHAYQITVRTLSPSIIPNLQDAVVSFFKSNPYIQKRIDVTRQNRLAKKKKLESETRKLDSLKNAIYDNYKSMADQARQGSNNVILSDKPVTSPIEVYRQGNIVSEDLEETIKDLYLEPDFEIVDGFTEFSEPASASMAKVVLYSLLIGIAVAYFDVALRAFNTYLAKLE